MRTIGIRARAYRSMMVPDERRHEQPPTGVSGIANTAEILDAITFGVAVIERDGTILATNRAWERFIDVAGSELGAARCGGNYLAMLQRLAREGNPFARPGLEAIEAVIRRERSFASLEHELRVHGAARWFLARATPLGDDDGRVVVTHLDITPRVMSHLALESANERLRVLSERLIAVEEQERGAIALDLHDDVGQSLASVAIGLHRLEHVTGVEHQDLLRQCSRVLGESLEKLRTLAGELRPVELEHGLAHSLEVLGQRVRDTAGVDIEFKLFRLEKVRPHRAIELACYRIVQEALNNAIRHARAPQIVVRVEGDDRLLKLNVRDNGVGFETRAACRPGSRRSGVGLSGMAERTRLAGGQLKVRSIPGSGTSVTAIFPLDAAPQRGQDAFSS
jgi:signal transduction histidine kinase